MNDAAVKLSQSDIPIEKMENIRVFYHKKGRAKYISHLDITRCMQRSLKRAALPVWYTEGFNPHIYLTFALPLALGYESECECMDLRLVVHVDFDEVKDRLNSSLPPDIRVVRVGLQQNKPEVIKKAVYEVVLSSEAISGQDLSDCIDNIMSEEKIDVVKHTKKGKRTIDIKPDISIDRREISSNSIKLFMTTSAGIDKNINPTLFTDEVIGKYNLIGMKTSVIRKAVLDINNNEFR